MPRHKRTDAEIERLKRIGDTAGLVRALDTSDPELRRAAIDALVATGVPVIPVLLREFSAPGNRAVKDGAGEVIRHLGKGAFGALRKVLKHEDERVRASAATAIGYTGEIAVPSLVEALDDPSKEVKSRAARSLEGIGWAPPPGQVQKHVIFHLFRGGMPELIRIRKSAFPHLITLLGENDYRTRIEVIRVLGRIRMPRGVPHLVLALSDNESDVRAAAAEALGEIGNIRVRPFLVRAMSDPAQNVRVEAVLALEKTGWRPENAREKVRYLLAKGQWDELVLCGPEAIPYLVDGLTDGHAHIRKKITGILAELGPPAIRELEKAVSGKDKILSPAAGEALTLIRGAAATKEGLPESTGAGNISWLLEEGETPAPGGEKAGDKKQDDAMQRAQKSPAGKIMEISEALKDPDATIRVAAIESLRVLGLPAAKTLIRCLEDGQKDVRAAAAEALGSIQSVQAVPFLIRRLVKDRETDVRKASAEALGLIKHSYAIPYLVRAFMDRDPEVRSAAATAAGRTGIPALKQLVSASRNPNAKVRSCVFAALMEANDPAVLPLIINGLNDTSQTVRDSAGEALHGFSFRSPDLFCEAAQKVLQRGTKNERLGILGALGRTDDKHAVWIVHMAVADPDEAVKKRASEVLRQKESRQPLYTRKTPLLPEDERHIRDLIRSLAQADPALRNAAVKKIKEIGTPAVRMLLSALDDPDTGSWEIIKDIIASMHEEVVDDLMEALQDGTAAEREAAVRILGSIPHERAVLALGWVLYGVQEPELRRLAAAALGNTGNKTGILPLVHCLDEEPKIKEAAILSIGKIGGGPAIDALISSLYTADSHTLRLVARSLELCSEDAKGPLTAALRHGSRVFRQNVAAVLDMLGWKPGDIAGRISYFVAKGSWDELKRFGGPALESLILALDDADEVNRRELARVIGFLGEKAKEPLIRALSDESAFIREGAALSLGCPGMNAKPPLVGALRDVSSAVRYAAATSLERTGWVPADIRQEVYYSIAKKDWGRLTALGSDAVPALVRGIYDSDPETRSGVVSSLGMIGDPRAVPYLIQFAEKSDDTGTAQEVIYSIGKIADKRAIGFLVTALHHPVFAIRTAAARALERIGWSPASDSERVFFYIAGEQPKKLAMMGTSAFPHIIRSLLDDQIMVRLLVTEALLMMGGPGIYRLRQVIQGDDTRLQAEAESVLFTILRGLDEAGRTGSAGTVSVVPDASARTGHRGRENISLEEVRRLMENPDENARIAAVDSLAITGLPATADLLKLAGDESSAVAVAALDALGRIGAKEAVPEIMRRLGHSEPDIRRAAAGALGSIRDPAAIPSLVECFTDPVPAVRARATFALACMGIAALGPVVEATEDKRAAVRLAALESLGQMRGVVVIHPLITSLGDDDEQVRMTGAGILSMMARDPAIPVLDILTDIMAEGDTRTRLFALEALSGIHDLRALDMIHLASYDDNDVIRNKAQEIIGRMDQATVALLEGGPEPQADKEEIERLIAVLEENDDGIRMAAAEKLLLMGRPAAGPLIAAIKSADRGVYVLIFGVLEKMKESITDELVGALNDDAAVVRLAAVALLSRIGQKRSVLALGDALSYETDAEVRKAVAEALGNMGDSHGVTPLVDLLNDRDITVRLAAIQSLGMVRGAGAIEPLIRQLGDEDDEILYTAGESLRMQGADARVPLVNALRVGDHHFRARVATILESIGGIPEDPVEKAYFLIGKERWYDLEAVGAPALQPLIETLSDRNIHVRLGAVNAISKIGGADAIRLLVTALNDDSPIVRKRAEKALVTIGQPAVGVLRNALGSGSVRFPDIARSTLRKIIPGSDDCSPDGT